MISTLLLTAHMAFFWSYTHGELKKQPITPVDPSLVCMTNDVIFGRPQIPVKVDGNTYYGCCQGCASRLQNESRMRYSNDPFTGNKVDKATAFIVEGPRGEALYFESVTTAAQYMVTMEK